MGKQASNLKGYDNIFARNLRKLMDRKSITQEELAKKAGCSRQAISQYMDGSSVPNVDKLLGIADYFGVSIDYLLGREDKPNENELINQICDYTGLHDGAISVLKSHTDVANSVRAFIRFALSTKGIDSFYFFCRRLYMHKRRLINYTDTVESLINLDTLQSDELTEENARKIAYYIQAADYEIDSSEYGLQKDVIELMKAFCHKEIKEKESIDEKYHNKILYVAQIAMNSGLSKNGVSIVDGGITYQILDEEGDPDGQDQETK